MPGIKHFYFADSIGAGDWFSYGTTLQDVRYAVEGYASFEGTLADETVLPDEVFFHYPACYGGDVWEGFGIYNYKRSLAARGVKTTSLIEGLAASIATLTALGSDTVLMADAAFWMVHKPHLDSYGDNADEHANAALLLNKIQGILAGRYVARSGGKLDLPTANNLMNQTSWLTADECMTYGFVSGKIADAPLVVPAGAEKVLNFLSKSALKTPAAMALNDTEKKGLFAEFKAWLTGEAPKASTGKAAKAETTEADKPAPKAEDAPKNDTMGTEMALSDGTSIFVDTSDDGVADIDEGDAVFTDEAMTIPVADGDYTLEDSRDFTVAGGVVSVIAADPAAETAAPAQAAAVAAEAPRQMSAQAKLKVAVARADAAEAKLRAHVPGAGNPNKPGAQAFAGSDSTAAHPLDGAAKKVNDKLHRGI